MEKKTIIIEVEKSVAETGLRALTDAEMEMEHQISLVPTQDNSSKETLIDEVRNLEEFGKAINRALKS